MTESKSIPPVHPGEILDTEFLEPYDLSQSEVANAIRVDAARINQIVRGERSITADTALRLAKYFDTTAGFWMNLQRQYDLRTVEAEKGEEIERDVQPLGA
jgi:addiction module HigA family antidote